MILKVSGHKSQCQTSDPNSTDDSGVSVDWKDEQDPDDTDVYVETMSMTQDDQDIITADSYAYAEMGYLEQYDEAGGLMVYAAGSADAEAYTPEATADAYAGTAGVTPGNSTGLFFRIMPDADEQVGDTVEISLDWIAEAQVWGVGHAACNNGFLGNDDPGSGITVAVNPSDKNIPPAASRVWEHPVVEQVDDGYASDSDQTTFTAQIGDVIGVFMGVDNEINIVGEESADLYTYQQIMLTIRYIGGPVYTAKDADIDASGRVDLGDIAIIAQFWLENVDTTGGNDGSTCAKAIEIVGYTTVSGDNYDALMSPTTTCGGDNDGNAVWYKYTSPEDTFVEFYISDFTVTGGMDASLAIYDMCNGMEIECDEGVSESIIYGMDPGETGLYSCWRL